MQILLTGSGGFIGKNIIEQIGDKYDFICPRSKDLNLLDENAVDEFFKNNNIDLIIHSASAGVRILPTDTLEQVAVPNITMFRNLSKHVSDKCRMITFGSGAEYDKSRSIHLIKESDFGEKIPKDPYGYAKYMISKEIENMDNVLNLRIFGIYGKYENPTRFTTYAIQCNLNKQPIVINQNVIFQFLYIDDFVKILDFFIQNSVQEKFINVCPSECIDLINLAKLINESADYKSKIIIKKEGLNNEYTGSNFLLLEYIRKFEFISYKEGLLLWNKQIKFLNKVE